ncbi:epoxide hydrolase, putative [Ricinus communis]|uniref:Epoxide hydrolase, putative n=1 Tax=Ricinus communis TaxID=3988 RepID=B9RH97_RICCO|nr:epoxide hydrolase, putative [Ricinus communis]
MTRVQKLHGIFASSGQIASRDLLTWASLVDRPRSPQLEPSQIFKKFGEGFYISQFQVKGFIKIEEKTKETLSQEEQKSHFAKYDSVTILQKFLLIDAAPDVLAAPPGQLFIDFLETPSSLASWVAEEELQFSASKFQETGFTGALNYYRAMNMNWGLLGPWQESKITVPTKLIVGDKDVGFVAFGTKDCINGENNEKSCT